jgi:hypothetical protein
MKKMNLVTGLVTLAVGLGVFYAYVWVAGKGWKKSQE